MAVDYGSIGKRIRAARIKRGLTQEQIANKIGVTAQHISNIETGNSRVSLSALIGIAEILEVSADDLLCDTVLRTVTVFQQEAQDILSECNEYEVRILVDILKAAQQSLRKTKLFEGNFIEPE